MVSMERAADSVEKAWISKIPELTKKTWVSRVRIQISTILQDIKQDSKNILLQDFSSEKGR